MASEAVKYVNIFSIDIKNNPCLFSYLFDMARYAVLHVFAKWSLLHLLQVLQEEGLSSSGRLSSSFLAESEKTSSMNI
jgi:hypothetical protein